MEIRPMLPEDWPEVARIYYGMVARQAEGDLRSEALKLLRGLGSP